MKLIQALLSSLVLLLVSNLSFAHGGVSIDEDVCTMRLGQLKAHFTGYQPDYRATQEFCEDIPVVGRSIFVIDFISEDLRTMHFDFRVIRDVKEIGNNAQLEDLGGPEAIEAATIFYQEKAVYPRGTLTATYDFTEKGRYIGIVTATYDDQSETLTSVFPFEVGLFLYWKYLIPILFIIFISTAVFSIFLKMTRKQDN
jgi:hypothetical protein